MNASGLYKLVYTKLGLRKTTDGLFTITKNDLSLSPPSKADYNRDIKRSDILVKSQHVSMIGPTTAAKYHDKLRFAMHYHMMSTDRYLIRLRKIFSD